MSARKLFTAEQAAHMIEEFDEEELCIDECSENEEDDLEINEDIEDEVELDSDDSDEAEEVDEGSDREQEDRIIKGKDGHPWHTTPPAPASYRSHNIIRDNTGPSQAVNGCDNYLELFRYIVDDTMLRFIVESTNKRLDEADHIDVDELETYIGINILLGVTKKRTVDISEIWSETSVHYMELCSLAMSRERYQLISRYITFDDIDRRGDETKTDKFYKMRFVFDRFRFKIQISFNPYSHLCVDEDLYAFRGKCAFRQYMPSKPAKYGIKYFCLNDVETSYLLDVIPYLGKEDKNANKQQNVGENIVMKLTKPYFNTGRGITTDNFFSSVRLSEELWKNGLTHVGTMRKNKTQIPPSFLPQKSRVEYSSLFAFERQTSIVSYVPAKRKAVILISSEHHSATVQRTEPYKPDIILAYNSTKGAVDTFDKLCESYSTRRFTNRWTLNCFFFILDAAAYNAYAIYIQKHPDIMNKNAKIQRRLNLKKLGKDLLERGIRRRVNLWKETNFVSVKKHLRQIAVKYGFLESPDLIHIQQPSQRRCQLCPRNADRKCNKRCESCELYICKAHQHFVCGSCI